MNVCVPSTGYTHGGVFHADDVFATALLQIINPEISIQRGFRVPDDFDGIVYDIGGGKYDHHSEPRAVRSNGIPYAAFGKLWAVYGPQLVGEKQTQWLDETFIQPLDSADNGGPTNPLCGAIAAMNPLWNAEEDSTSCFWAAVAIAKQILSREIQSCLSKQAASDITQAALQQKGRIVVIDRFAPIITDLCGTDKAFLVFPSQRGGWNAQVVQVSPSDRTAVVPFPKDWWGASAEQLPDGVTFCHASGFLLAATTKEAAISACLTALSQPY